MSATKIVFFVQEKKEKYRSLQMLNEQIFFLRISYFEFKISKLYVLDYSESINMHIQK